MGKKGKSIAITLFAALSVGTLIAATACKEEPDDQQTPVTYTVTYDAGATDYYGEADTFAYTEGQKFNLLPASTFERNDYVFTEWNDGTTAYLAGAEYTMPAHDVKFTAVWEREFTLPSDAETIQSFPANAALETDSGDATAYWNITYGEASLIIDVYVKDATVYASGSVFQNDGVQMYISKVQRVKEYTEDTVSVIVDAKGTAKITKPRLDNENFADSGIVTAAHYVTLDGETAAGYHVTVTVPDAAAEFTAAQKDAALCLALTNASNAGNASTVVDDTYGAKSGNVHTYMAVTDNNTFAQNANYQYGKTWGDAGDLIAAPIWNMDNDDGTAGASITMDGNSGDNYVYMHSSNKTEMYAEVQLTVENVYKRADGSYDGAPKFGLNVVSADGAKGFAYYVQADSSTTNGSINENSVGLGRVMRSGAGNGAWTGWTDNIGNMGGKSSKYQAGNYITLGVYRSGSIFRLTYEGDVIATISTTIGAEEEAYVGLFSFNLKLRAKNYSVKDDSATLDQYRITPEAVEYLFLGDSYIDTAFWYTYNNQFGNESAANIGVGGTQTAYWINQATAVDLLYDPQNIIMHIGVNDIDDGDTTGETAIERLDRLFETYQTKFPDAQIYYVSLVHNMMFPDKWVEYDKVNAHVKELEGITFIDMAQYITADENNSTMRWFNWDGLHYGVEGYSMFDYAVTTALGINRTATASGLGNVVVEDQTKFSYTSGWKNEEGIWHNTQSKDESKLPISEAIGANVYASADISVAGMYNGEKFGKAGLAVSSSTATYFFYINLSEGANPDGKWDDNYGSLTYRPEVRERNWHYPEDKENPFKPFGGNGYVPLGNQPYDHNEDPNAYKTLAIAKIGTTLYFFASNGRVGTVEDAFGEDEVVTVSVFNFNTNMYAKNGAATVGTKETVQGVVDDIINAGKPVKTMDGSLADWTEAEKSNPVQLAGPNGQTVTVYATMDRRGVNIFYDIYHTKYVNNVADDWSLNTNIEFRLGSGKTQYWMNARNEKGGIAFGHWSTTDPEQEGGLYHTVAEMFVLYENIDGSYNSESAYVPAGFAFRTDGQGASIWSDAANGFWYVPEADPNMRNFQITTNGLLTGTEKAIDGDLADWSTETFSPANTKAGITARYAELYKKGDGLYLALEIKAQNINITNTNTAGDWWKNTNFEFFNVASGSSRVMFFDGALYHSGYITDAAFTFTKGGEGAEDTLTVEIFISEMNLDKVCIRVTDNNIILDLGGQFYSAVTDTWQDYLRDHEIAADGASKVIDGSMDDWAAEQKETFFSIPATEGRSITVYATMTDYGVKVFYDAYHKTYVNDKPAGGDWHLNTNAEMRFGNNANKQVWFNSRQAHDGGIFGVMQTANEGSLHHTVADLFIPYSMIADYDKNSAFVPAGFAFKTGGEIGNAWLGGDYWFAPEAAPTDLRCMITKQGIFRGTEKTIDGDLSDWTETTTINGNSTWAAHLGSDGLYYGITIKKANMIVDSQNTWHMNGENFESDWWLNTNIEFSGDAGFGHRGARIMMFNGKLYYTGNVTYAASKFIKGTDGAEDQLVIEVFIANRLLNSVTAETQSCNIKVGGQTWYKVGEETKNDFAWYADNVTVTRAAQE